MFRHPLLRVDYFFTPYTTLIFNDNINASAIGMNKTEGGYPDYNNYR